MVKVIVVGAGAAGLGIGWRLVQSGAEVMVLERAQVGSGATYASAGMIAAAAELGSSDNAEAVFARKSAAMWPGFASDLEAAAGIDIGYRKNGALIVTTLSDAKNDSTPEHATGERLDRDRALAKEPTLARDIASALWVSDEAVVDTQALCRALAVAFVRAGGVIQSNETVVRVESEAGEVRGVLTPFAFHQADAYVLAAGAWTSRIEGLPQGVVPPVIPVKGEIITLSPPTDQAMPAHVVWGNGVYIVPRGGRVLVGATVEMSGFDTSLSRAASNWLHERAVALLPALKAWSLSDHWAGLRPGSPDGWPILGKAAVDKLFVASGQYRNGILFAPAIAEFMSELVRGRQTAIAEFDPGRFGAGKASEAGAVSETPHRGPGSGGRVGEWRIGS